MMTGFTTEQQALIEKLAYDVGNTIAVRLEEKFDTAIRLHAATCPSPAKAKADALTESAERRKAAIETHAAECKTVKAVNRLYWMAAGFGFAGLAGGGWVGYAIAALKTVTHP